MLDLSHKILYNMDCYIGHII